MNRKKHLMIGRFFSLLVGASLLLAGCSVSSGQTGENHVSFSALPQSNALAVSSQSSSRGPSVSSMDSSRSSEAASPSLDKPVSSILAPSDATSVPSGDSIDSSQPSVPSENFFDDAVFIGDSVSLKLKYYAMKQRNANIETLGEAQFLTSGSMGSGNALQPVSPTSVHPTYQGTKLPLEQAVAKSGAKKVYIMLGMNDIALYGLEQSLNNMNTLIHQIRGQVPGVAIYLQSVTPILKGHEKKQLNNNYIQQYNHMLADFCKKNGYTFVDVTSVLQDDNGYLPAKFCSDPEGMGIHFTDLACSVWVEYLYSHT